MTAVGSPWGVLLAVCMYRGLVDFLCSLPSVLSTPLQLYLNLSESQYAYLVSALYTAYSIPNIFLPFFAGPLLHRCGERGVLLLTFTVVALGQLMVVFSLQMRIQSGMIAGRLLFGLGGEIMTVLACEIVTRWFRYVNLAKDRQTGGERESSKTNWERKNISTVLAFMFSVSKLGVATVLPATQRLCEVYGVVPASWIATWGSLTAGALAVCYLACIGREKSLDMETLLEDINDDPVRNDPNGTTNTSYLSIVTSYPYVFWLLGVICILGCGSIDTFSNSAQRFLASVFYAGSQRDAASATSFLFIISSISAPLLGYILDSSLRNHAAPMLLLANILILLAHTLFLTTPNALVPLGILGLASAVFSVSFSANLTRCLFSTVKFLQQKHGPGHQQEEGRGYGTMSKQTRTENAQSQEIIAMGFGCMTCLTNLAAAAIPVVLAMTESVCGYQGLEMVFWVMGALGCLVAGHLVVIDRFL